MLLEPISIKDLIKRLDEYKDLTGHSCLWSELDSLSYKESLKKGVLERFVIRLNTLYQEYVQNSTGKSAQEVADEWLDRVLPCCSRTGEFGHSFVYRMGNRSQDNHQFVIRAKDYQGCLPTDIQRIALICTNSYVEICGKAGYPHSMGN